MRAWLAALTMACGAPGEPVDLTQAADWSPMLNDPLDHERPPDARPCGQSDVGAEDDNFEIRTEACNWATFSQPLTATLRPGDHLLVGLTHLDLWASSPADVVIALGIGEAELWRWTARIPRGSGILEEDLELAEAYAMGQPLWIHIHNHGTNSYRLTRLQWFAP